MDSLLVLNNLNVTLKMMSNDYENDVVHLYPIYTHERHAKISTRKKRKVGKKKREIGNGHVINHYLKQGGII